MVKIVKRKTKLLTVFIVLAVVCSIASSSVLALRETTTAINQSAHATVESAGSRSLSNGPVTDPQDTPVATAEVQQERQDPELAKVFRKYDLLKLDPRTAAAQIRQNGKLLLGTSDGQFDLQLAPYDIRSQDYAAQVIGADGVPHKLMRTPVNTYKGEVKGHPRAQARMTIENDTLEGAIIMEGERYFLQPARALSKASRADEFVFYKGSDVIKEAGECGVTLADEVAAEEERARAAANAEGTANSVAPSSILTSEITGLSPLKVVRLLTDADAEYVTALGGGIQANNQILSIMNQVDGIYQVEIGVKFEIVFQNNWSDVATDPYISTVPGTLLGQFRDHWNTTPPNPTPRDLAHLWTGKDLDGGTIGVAYVGVVCASSANSYGLSQRYPVTPANPITASTVVLTTHEIGHNFGGRHVNVVTTEIPADIELPCDNSIMEASVGSGMSFCPFSRSQIIGFANVFATCLQNSASGPPVFPSCSETPIDFGVLANGALASNDCRSPSRGVGFLADRYSFQGTAGQRLTITMTRSGGGTLAPYVYLIGPAGYVLSQNGSGNSSSAISVSGAFTLPDTGKYLIEATSLLTGETGSYTVNVTLEGCTLSVSPTSQHFPAGGGNGTINVTATGSSCGTSYEFINSPNTASWLSPQVTGGTGSQALNFTVTANTNSAGRRAFLLVGAAINDFTGGLRIPITQSGTSPDCSLTPIGLGQTVGGTLTTSSCQSPIRGDNFYSNRYVFTVSAGQQVSISMSSTNAPNTDTFISLVGPNGVVILTDDDSGGITNSRIPGGTGFLTLGLPGTYIIEASLFAANQTGSYTLTLTSNGAPTPPPTILTEQGTTNAVALDSVTHVGGPFTVLTPHNFSADGHRRVIIFTSDLGLNPGDNLSVLTVQAQGTSLTVEGAGPLSAVPQTSYIIVRLPTGLPAGNLPLTVTLSGISSINTATIGIQ